MKRSQLFLFCALLQFLLLIPLARWAEKRPSPPREIILTRLFQKKQKPWKRKATALTNTLTGSAPFLNTLVVPAGLLLWILRLRKEALAMLATCWISISMNTLLKRIIDRPRPQRGLVRIGKQSRGKSFPSGHVASAVCLWGWLIAVALFARSKVATWLAGIPVLLIAFTGPARVYLGDHWATDVLGGYLFGGGWLSLSLGLYMRLRDRLAFS